MRSILSDPDHNRPNGYYYCYQGDNQVVNHYTFTKCVVCVVTMYNLDNSVDIRECGQKVMSMSCHVSISIVRPFRSCSYECNVLFIVRYKLFNFPAKTAERGSKTYAKNSC